MPGQFNFNGTMLDDASPWKSNLDSNGLPINVGGTQQFNYDDLLGGNYNYDDLLNNVYGNNNSVSYDGGYASYKPVDYNNLSPEERASNVGSGVLNGLGTVTGSGYNVGQSYMNGGGDTPTAYNTYKDPTSLFIDNQKNGSNTEGANWNYTVTKDPTTGKAIATKQKRYEDQMGGGGWEVLRNTALAATLLYGGASALGATAGEGAAGAGAAYGGAEAGGATLAGSGSAAGGGFGGYGGLAMDTGAFDLGGTFGGVEGAGGYSSGLADLFGGGGSSLLGDVGTGAFDMGGSYGGAEGAGGVTGDYLSSGLQYMDPSMTGAFDQTGSQGAGLGFGGSDSSYGLSNLYSDAKMYGGQLNDLNNITQKYTGQNVSQLGRGIYDAYAKNKISNSAGSRADQLQNLFSNDSPYAQQLQKQLAVRDSASGRNSQYGPRSVELQAKLAELQAGVLNSKNYNDLRNTQTNSKLSMFNSLVANSAANAIMKNTPALVSSALNSVSKFIGF